MNCANHPDNEAAGACVRCGKMLCKSCALVLANRVYCQPCADGVFTNKSPTGVAKNRSGLLTAGGVLSIIGGAMSLLYALMFVPFVFLMALVPTGDTDGSTDDSWIFAAIFGPMIIILGVLGVMAIVGGIYALKRKRFGLALGGAICGAFTAAQVFGILAIVFIAMSRKEFEKKAPAVKEALP